MPHTAKYTTVMLRSWRLRCPRCGAGRLFSGWFRMRPACDACGLPFEREPGFYLGSIYVNYGLTALVVTGSYLVGFLTGWVADRTLLAGLSLFCVLFPLWFFRYARSIWLGFDYFWDPPEARSDPRAVKTVRQD